MIVQRTSPVFDNPQNVCFGGLPEDIAALLLKEKHRAVCMDAKGAWKPVKDGAKFVNNGVYKLKDVFPPFIDVKMEPAHNASPFHSFYVTSPDLKSGEYYVLSNAPSLYDFEGIIYRKDGVDSLSMVVDPTLGTPIAVRRRITNRKP